MNLTIPINTHLLTEKWKTFFTRIPLLYILVAITVIVSIFSSIYSYYHGDITAYGDAESHLNIAKRVISGLTPGAAQLGGIWLPLPHLLMVPFAYFDPLWRSGIAGSIISGISFVIASVYLYKLTHFITKNTLASLVSFVIFISNPNLLYMQSTPMTELPLIAFFMLSTFYFITYMYDDTKYPMLILAGFFGFCATLSRYDGWFLVLVESGILGLQYMFKKNLWNKLQGRVVLFATLAFFGIFLWLLWDFLILGDPLYFTHSQFSAKAQQQDWYLRGELPGYKNLFMSLLYYSVTAMSNVGIILFSVSIIGIVFFLLSRANRQRFFVFLILFVPFFFNIITLFLGQSVIFIPDITPSNFEWKLFNVRYGILMIPAFSFFTSYLFYKARLQGKLLIVFLIFFQLALFGIGYSRNIVLADGTVGLSASKHPQAEQWIADHYDHGLVLLDDYARTLSVLKSTIPMQNIIYVGTKPYWEESFVHPQKYARWIVMQKDDEVWKHINNNPTVRGELYKYFLKEYTSPEILIFKRNDVPAK